VAQLLLYPDISLERLVGRDISVKIHGVEVDIRTKHLRNISLDLCVAAMPTRSVLLSYSGGNYTRDLYFKHDTLRTDVAK
jgi:hypothetical protein